MDSAHPVARARSGAPSLCKYKPRRCGLSLFAAARLRSSNVTHHLHAGSIQRHSQHTAQFQGYCPLISGNTRLTTPHRTFATVSATSRLVR